MPRKSRARKSRPRLSASSSRNLKDFQALKDRETHALEGLARGASVEVIDPRRSRTWAASRARWPTWPNRAQPRSHAQVAGARRETLQDLDSFAHSLLLTLRRTQNTVR